MECEGAGREGLETGDDPFVQVRPDHPEFGTASQSPASRFGTEIEADEDRVGGKVAECPLSGAGKHAAALVEPAGPQAERRARGAPGDGRAGNRPRVLPDAFGREGGGCDAPQPAGREGDGIVREQGMAAARPCRCPPHVELQTGQRRVAAPSGAIFLSVWRVRRHEVAQLGIEQRPVQWHHQAAEVVPERSPQRVEGRDFLLGKRPCGSVAERGAGPEAGLPQGNPGHSNAGSRDDGRFSVRRQRRIEVHQAMPVDGAVGIDAGAVGGLEKPLHQVLARELVTKEVFHQRESAGDHRGRKRRSGQACIALDYPTLVWSEIGGPHMESRCGDAPVGGDSAAVGKGGDLPVLPGRHGGHGVTLELLDSCHRSREQGGGTGVKQARRASEMVSFTGTDTAGGARAAELPMAVPGRPYENRLVLPAGLGQYPDRPAQRGPDFRLVLVVLDRTDHPETQVQDVQVMGKDPPEEIRFRLVILGQTGEGDRPDGKIPGEANFVEGDGKHSQCGMGHDAGELGSAVRVLPARDDAGNAGAVGEISPGRSRPWRRKGTPRSPGRPQPLPGMLDGQDQCRYRARPR